MLPNALGCSTLLGIEDVTNIYENEHRLINMKYTCSRLLDFQASFDCLCNNCFAKAFVPLV